MAWTHDLGWLGMCFSLLSGAHIAAAAGATQDFGLRADLLRLSQRRIFFGHQSVGMNLLDGVRQIAGRYPEVALHVVETSDAGELAPGTFAHGFMPENGDPERKLESFERVLSSGIGVAADVAFIKFCYTDFSAATDVPALFARYQATLRALHARYPRTIFVHVTTPLTTVEGGAKSTLKRLLGRTPNGVLENAKREHFNELLRSAYLGKKPVFDLARLESSAPDGHREIFAWKGTQVPALLSSYTEDGGHLTPDARVRFARELIALLASLPQAQ